MPEGDEQEPSSQPVEAQPMSPQARWGLSIGIALLLLLMLLTLGELAGFAVLVGLILFAALAFVDRALLARSLGLLTVAVAVMEYADPERLFGSWTLVIVMGLVALLAFVSSEH